MLMLWRHSKERHVDTRSVMLVDEDVDFILLSCKVTEQHHINYY
jgi:hypothetical protein